MKRFILAVCVLLMGACAKDIVKLSGDIKGVVRDYDNSRLIENCEITITPGGYSTVTNSNGVWQYADLEPGEYTITYRKAGYYDESRKANIVSGQLTNVDVLLRAKSAFDLSETYYDFGDYTSEHTFTCYNNSDGICNYEITNIPEWITCNKRSGSVYSGSSDTFRLGVDRDMLSEGEHRRMLTVKYSGNTAGEVTLEVVVKKVKLTTPTVSIADTAKEIGKNYITIEAKVESMGGAQITEHGFYWGTSQSNMTQYEDLGILREAVSFSHTISGLDYNTTYYIKAYARNSQGVAYSKVISVTTQDKASDKWDGSKASEFAGGSGTSGSPYLIETGAQLVLMKDYSGKCFRLIQDINLDNRAWPSFDFSGKLDGDGFVISNLKVTKGGDNLGLFATLTGTVKDLTISGVAIETTGDNVGAIAGYISDGGVITNCAVQLNNSSIISGNYNVGGVVGEVYGNDITVTESTVVGVATANQIVGNMCVGGIVGSFAPNFSVGAMEGCKVSANISGATSVGGIIGYMRIMVADDFYVEGCSFEGELSAENFVAGIIGNAGDSDYGDIRGCKADVKISVDDNYAAGIVTAEYFADNAVYGSYATGEIECMRSNADAVGGLVAGKFSGYIDCCYSMVVCDASKFSGLSGCSGASIANSASIMPELHSADNCTSSGSNFSEFLQSCYSDYADYWNFNNTWTWTGKVDGQGRSVECPRLTWE